MYKRVSIRYSKQKQSICKHFARARCLLLLPCKSESQPVVPINLYGPLHINRGWKSYKYAYKYMYK